MAFTEFLNAVDAGIQVARQRIKEDKTLWNADKIKWEQTDGCKGSYEKSEDVNNPEFKLMLKDLATHNGKFTKDAFFYWVFKNGSTVGRKKRGKKAEVAEAKAKAGLDPAQFFPEDLRSFLSFEQKADVVIIKAKQFLSSENFAKILDVVKQHHGEYVSAGRNSHFRIPIKN